jgi:hypothetical protein
MVSYTSFFLFPPKTLLLKSAIYFLSWTIETVEVFRLCAIRASSSCTTTAQCLCRALSSPHCIFKSLLQHVKLVKLWPHLSWLAISPSSWHIVI